MYGNIKPVKIINVHLRTVQNWTDYKLRCKLMKKGKENELSMIGLIRRRNRT
jgi:hypothetical protein